MRVCLFTGYVQVSTNPAQGILLQLWPREQFESGGIDYRVTSQTKTDLFRELFLAIHKG